MGNKLDQDVAEANKRIARLEASVIKANIELENAQKLQSSTIWMSRKCRKALAEKIEKAGSYDETEQKIGQADLLQQYILVGQLWSAKTAADSWVKSAEEDVTHAERRLAERSEVVFKAIPTRAVLAANLGSAEYWKSGFWKDFVLLPQLPFIIAHNFLDNNKFLLADVALLMVQSVFKIAIALTVGIYLYWNLGPTVASLLDLGQQAFQHWKFK